SLGKPPGSGRRPARGQAPANPEKRGEGDTAGSKDALLREPAAPARSPGLRGSPAQPASISGAANTRWCPPVPFSTVVGIAPRDTRVSVANECVPRRGGRHTLAEPGRFAGSNQSPPAP